MEGRFGEGEGGGETGASAALEPTQYRPVEAVGLYNGTVAPLAPYGIRGALWYQGESDVPVAKGKRYRKQLTALIKDWRERGARAISRF